MVTENQKSELITDQAVTIPESEQKIESISEQQQPQLIAQTEDSNQDDVNKIRQELLIEPLLKLKTVEPKPTYPPKGLREGWEPRLFRARGKAYPCGFNRFQYSQP